MRRIPSKYMTGFAFISLRMMSTAALGAFPLEFLKICSKRYAIYS